jgi:hypothetical protein
MSAVRDRLREQPLPGEAEAAVRSWPVVEAALAERASDRGRRAAAARPRRTALRLALVAALLAAGVVAALSPAGAVVGDWIGDRFATGDESAAPAFGALPKGGSVLAISRSGAYAISPDGSAQWLGSFSDAGWSPHGRHVVGAEGKRLTAVNPLGTIKWTLFRPHRLHHPAWSTGLGFAVAYLEGTTLRSVAGDGDPSTNRRLRAGAAPVTPAWRPQSDRVLTYATTAGTIETLDIATGRTLWRTSVGGTAGRGGTAEEPLRTLAWSRSGRRLVALSSRSVTVLDATGHVRRTITLPGVGRELALHPSGREAAVVVSRGREKVVLEVPLAGAAGARRLFQGDVDGLAWSRDGRRLLLAWRDADEWLLLGPGGRVRALHGVSRELGAAGGFPRVAGWCCAG